MQAEDFNKGPAVPAEDAQLHCHGQVGQGSSSRQQAGRTTGGTAGAVQRCKLPLAGSDTGAGVAEAEDASRSHPGVGVYYTRGA